MSEEFFMCEPIKEKCQTTPDNRTAIEHQAQALIQRAAAVGLNVSIETRPLQPLAMRHYELVVTVWEIR